MAKINRANLQKVRQQIEDRLSALGSGTVTSVSGTGTVNGVTLSGTVTSSGNITLGGTLAINNSDWSGADLSLANGGTGASLSDPGADRILFWDDSAGAVTWLEAGSGITITDTTISASGGGSGATGSFESADGQIITVTSGLITDISPVLWTPADITTQMWIEFDDDTTVVTNGSGEITDALTKTPSSSLKFTGTSGVDLVTDGTLGVDVADFDGTARLVSNLSNATNWTDGSYYHIAVVRPDAGTDAVNIWNNAAIIGDAQAGWNNLMITDDGVDTEVQFYHWDGGPEGTSASITLGNWMLLSQENSGGFIRGRVNGGTEVTDAASNQTSGATMDMGSGEFDGRIVAYLRLSEAPTEANRQRIEGYFAHKYGLQSELPGGHPYKTDPPLAP